MSNVKLNYHQLYMSRFIKNQHLLGVIVADILDQYKSLVYISMHWCRLELI